MPSAFWAAGFAFSSAQVIAEVPYDPHLEHLFFGEEMSMVLRLWTHGWDFFAPHKTVVFHCWDKTSGKKHGGNSWRPMAARESVRQRSVRRVLALITGRRKSLEGVGQPGKDYLAELDQFGLGDSRSVRQYQDYSGVNFNRRVVQAKALFGNEDPNMIDARGQAYVNQKLRGRDSLTYDQLLYGN